MKSTTTAQILVVLAHPDDETGLAGTLAKYSSRGIQVDLACATLGELGEISDSTLATRQNLGAVREQELRHAAGLLGIRELHLLGDRDSGMRGADGNHDPRSLNRAAPTTVVNQLVGLIRSLQPQIVITFEPFGGYGHPDHVMISRYTREAFERASDPASFPDAGLVWSPFCLYFVVFPRFLVGRMRAIFEAAGVDAS